MHPSLAPTELVHLPPGSRPGTIRMAVIGVDGPTGTLQEDDGELGW